MKHFIQVCAVPLLFFIAACGRNDQNTSLGAISGKVINIRTHQPVANVKVAIPDTAFSTTTKDDGSFKLSFAPGSFTVHLTKDGYFLKEIAYTLSTATDLPAGDIAILPKTVAVKKVDPVTEIEYIEYIEEGAEQGAAANP